MSNQLARGIWPALVSPFIDDGSALAPERVKPLIDHLLDMGSTGFFVCGGTGEGIAMSVPERKAMTEATIAASSVTSNAAAEAARPRSRSRFTRSSSVCASRPFSTTWAPASAIASAMAQPSPREDPVTSATRPARSKSFAMRISSMGGQALSSG